MEKIKRTRREVGNCNCYDEIYSWTVPLFCLKSVYSLNYDASNCFDEGYFLCRKKSWQQIAVKCGGFVEGIRQRKTDFISILEGIFAESKNIKTTCGQWSGADIFNLNINNLLLRGSLSDLHVAAQLTHQIHWTKINIIYWHFTFEQSQ